MARILVVDDADFMRVMLSGMLKKRGHEILEAGDGEEAVEVYKRERPDLVTMDITMPKKDGIAASLEILAEDPSAKIIMISALDQQGLLRNALKAGVKEFIVKPFTVDTVWTTVDRILEK